jgi:signal transduction histidine kinase
MKAKKQSTYLKDIGVISWVFIFLILFLALLNFFISVQFRKEYQRQEKERIVSLAGLCAGYLEKYSNPADLQYLMLNLRLNFEIDRFVITSTDGTKIFDSWLDLPDLGTAPNVDYGKIFAKLPQDGQVLIRGDQYLYFNREGGYYFYATTEPMYGKLDTLFRWHIIYVTISLVFISFLGFFLIRNLFMPMRYVAGVAREFGIEFKREDFVAETFNELFAKMKGRERLLVEFSSYIAHEFRNSIAAISGLARLMEKGKKDSSAIVQECREMEKLIANLLEYSRPMKPMSARVDLTQLMEDALARTKVPERIKVEKKFAAGTYVDGDPELLLGLAANLIKNGVEAIEGEGVLKLETGREEGTAYLAVADTGTGIDEADQEHIFSPFYSRKETGVGLGLAYVKKIVEIHNARIEVRSKKGEGSRSVVKFPVVETI